MTRLLFNNTDIKLFLLYVFLSTVIIFKFHVDIEGYQSLDSHFYLELAQNLVESKGFYRSTEYPIPEIKTPDNQIYFSAWPVGYPIMIFLVAKFVGIDVWIASKIVNLLCLGMILLLIRKIAPKEAFFVSMVLCSFTFLEVYSYTWSEAPFLLFLLWYCVSLSNYLQHHQKKLILHLFFAALGMFLCRYIGAFSFILLGAIGLYKSKREPQAASAFISLSVILVAINLIYFYMNYLNTGDFDGGERFHPYQESFQYFVWLLFRGVFNEILIIRNYYFGYWPEPLWWCTTLFQVIIIWLIIKKFRQFGASLSFPKKDTLPKVLFVVGFFYLLVLIFIRKLSPFDEFDYRLLSPFSFLIFLGIQLLIVHQTKVYPKVKLLIELLFIISLMLNLPKAFIVSQIKDFLL